VETVQKRWEDFDALYSIVASKESSNEDRASYFARAKGWVTLFTSLRDKKNGYRGQI